MELRDYAAVLRRHLALIVAVTLICIAAASFLTIRSAPQYVSSSQLFVRAVGSVEDNSAFQGSQFALQRVKSYANLNRLTVAERVVNRLDLEESARSLVRRVTVFAIPDTVLLGVSAQSTSKREAQLVSQTFSEELVKYVVELESTAESGPRVSLRMVGSASTPDSPDSPLPIRNLLLAAALGLVLGAAAATLRDNLDPRIRSTADLEKTVDVPCLGTVTYDSSANKKPLLRDLGPAAPRAEAYRVLRTNLQVLAREAGPSAIFLVTGSVPGEGKATVAANVAETLAEGGRSVLLVEADMREPTLGQHFGLETDRGLSTVLTGRTGLSEAIQPSGRPNLDVITSGPIASNPAELLQSDAMAQFVAALRARYQFVIIDSPPLLPVADATLCALQADGTILVVQEGRTSTPQIRAGIERLAVVGAQVVGTILVRAQKFTDDSPTRRYGRAPAHAGTPDEHGYWINHPVKASDPVQVSDAPASQPDEAADTAAEAPTPPAAPRPVKKSPSQTGEAQRSPAPPAADPGGAIASTGPAEAPSATPRPAKKRPSRGGKAQQPADASKDPNGSDGPDSPSS